MRRHSATAFILLFAMGMAGRVGAQVPPAAAAPAERSADSAPNLLTRHFNANSPPVGSVLPDVRALDAEGKEFRLSELQGHYSVLVFGCLT